MLIIIAYFFIIYVLPVLGFSVLVWLVWRSFHKTGQTGAPVSEAEAKNLKDAADKAYAEAVARRKKAEMAATMKEQGRLDRLALVYFVESAMKDGGDEAAITAALREKGWPAGQVEAAVRGYREIQPGGPELVKAPAA